VAGNGAVVISLPLLGAVGGHHPDQGPALMILVSSGVCTT
jgi:hypothetical protein